MGSKGAKPRKGQHHLPKAPKYEEPNVFPGGGAGRSGRGFGSRYGHSAGGHHEGKPGKTGSWLLRKLGLRPKGAGGS